MYGRVDLFWSFVWTVHVGQVPTHVRVVFDVFMSRGHVVTCMSCDMR